MSCARQIAMILVACLYSEMVLSGAAPSSAVVGFEPKITKLLKRMTMEEKIGQMSQSTSIQTPISAQIKEEIRRGRWGSFLNAGSPADRAEAQRIATKESRLHIPLLFGRDVIHGYRTVFPIPLGQSASWDPELISAAARIAAREASADGIRWTFAPMIDITRDPRWGRIAEGLGEDPYLTGVLGAAMVRGFQGQSLAQEDAVAACAKHYVGYGAAEGGREYNSTWIPEGLLRDVYLPPFQAALSAGVASIMTAFNAINGVPSSGNHFTLDQILRREWKFDGVVVSDYESITEMVRHGYARDPRDAAMKAVHAGVDMEMVSTSYFDYLKGLVASGQLSMTEIDESVRRILRLKFRLGLFGGTTQESTTPIDRVAELETAKRLATESVVLLKNQAHVLPLSRDIRKVAIIGPLANSPVDQMGTWTMDGRAEDVITPLAAIREKLGLQRVLYTPGLASSRDLSHEGFAAALQTAREADATILFLGEEQILSGEAHSRAFLDLPGAQEALVNQLAQAGKPMIVVIMAGRPLTFHAVAQTVSAILYAWHPGTMGGSAIADLLFGDATPSGKLTVTFPRTVGQIPIYYSHLNTGRPPSPGELGIPMGNPVRPTGYTSKYVDVDFTAEYPFGFGLSYTTFQYSNLRVSPSRVRNGGTLTASADITNTGTVAGDEIAQLYIRDLVASVARPIRELKAFRRIRLAPGEKRKVTFSISTDDLAFHDQQMKLVTESGHFQVWVAPDSTGGVEGEFIVE